MCFQKATMENLFWLFILNWPSGSRRFYVIVDGGIEDGRNVIAIAYLSMKER